MARHMPGTRSSHHDALKDTYSLEESLAFAPKWYFTEEEIDKHSPSRKDGIDLEYESHLRKLYCSYLQELGMELKVPQVTIATAMMLCHRFYMRQSHAKNHWQAVSNSCMFLACKAEDTPRWLKNLTMIAYRLMYRSDPLAPQKIRQKEVCDKQKELIILGEKLILCTVAFDLNIEHPYKPLVAALKKLEISDKEVVRVAWNFVNDWLRTTLCLQYKPHYVAAGSVFLAAKLKKIKLPTANGKAWWMQFDVSPKQLEGSGHSAHASVTRAECHASNAGHERSEQQNRNPRLSNATRNRQKLTLLRPCSQLRADSGSANSVVEDGDAELIIGDSNQKSGCKIISFKERCPEIDIVRIREKLKTMKNGSSRE
ncbi:cyclin-t1-4 [Phtheirospermum japonicum]|uniref:Cyclin-t1-4 n=1 Tax=Phtheirospermum japonicum TaxID=374723 RepID=A0A830CWM7_9LAMI|nr:cyclin-t1-4 [Phtheirospermum japonicum]